MLMLSGVFLYSQTGPLQVWNFSNQPLFIWAGAANGCGGVGAVAATPQLVQPGDFANFNPLAGPGAQWIGFKAMASFNNALPPYGKFYNECAPCGIDQSVGLSVQWDTANGCFRARVF